MAETNHAGLTRRRCLGALAAVAGFGGMAMLAACGAAPAAAPTTAPAKAAEPTKPAAAPEPTKPAAAAATTAPAAATPTAAQAAAKPAAATGPVTLEYWGNHPEELEPHRKVMEDFKAKNPNVTVNVIMTPNDQAKAKLETSLNAGSGPDLFQAPSRPTMDDYFKTGNLLDLTKDVDFSQVVPFAKDAITVEGKVWALPSGRYTVGICYHRDLLEKAGITKEPITWADMRNAMAQLKEKNITPYSIAAKDGSLTYFTYIGLASSMLGVEGFNAVQDGKKKLNEDDMVKVVQEMIDWVPYYQPNFLGTPYAEAKALFATQKTAMMDCGSADLSGYYEIKPDAKLGFFYWPAPEAAKKQVTNTGMNVIYGVNAKTKARDGAITFGNWVVSPDGAKSHTTNIKVLPVVKDVKPAGDPILTKMVETPLDVSVWYERWATLNIGDVWAKEGNSAFDKAATAKAFADKLQKSVDDQIANKK